MTHDQEAHLHRIKHRFVELVDVKYRAGQAEHGGDMWKRANGDELVAESIDFVAYAMTIEQQHDEIKNLCVDGIGSPDNAVDALQKIKALV